MDIQVLRQLDEFSHASPSKLPDAQAALSATISERANARWKGRLVDAFAASSEPLRHHIDRLEVAFTAGAERDIAALLLTSLAAAHAPDSVVREAAARLSELQVEGGLSDPLLPALPLERNPLIFAELRRARFIRVAEAAGIGAERADQLSGATGAAGSLTDGRLGSWVDQGKLTAAEAVALGRSASLHRLLDHNSALVKAVSRGAFPNHRNLRVDQLRDLAILDLADWEGIIDRAKIIPRAGVGRDEHTRRVTEYAALLAKRLEILFPCDVLLDRMLPKPSPRTIRDISSLGPLIASDVARFGSSVGLRLEGVAQPVRGAITEAYRRLERLANSYPGLGLAETLNARDLTAAQKAARMEQRIELVRRLRSQNPSVDLLSLDYSPGGNAAQLAFGDMDAGERRLAIAPFKAYQRVKTITGDLEDAYRLVAAGYASATAAADVDPGTLAARSGVDARLAVRYQNKALSIAGTTAEMASSVRDLVGGGFDALRVANIPLSLRGYFKELDGFEALLGGLDACACQHCRSVLSPAAYFVDLMWFIDQHINTKVFPGDLAQHPLHLKVRRPDLWTLPLTCANSDEEIAALDVINPILENAIATKTGLTDLDDRAAVETRVYQDTLATSVDSLTLPFNLPLLRLRQFLSPAAITPLDVAVALEAPPQQITVATFDLAPRDYALITQPSPAADFSLLSAVFDLDIPAGAETTSLDPIDAQVFLKAMAIPRDDLGALLVTRFVSPPGGENAEIKLEKSTPDEVQANVELVHGLRPSILDRIHRFARLRRHVPWTIGELDLILFQLGVTGLTPQITPEVLDQLATVHSIQQALNLPVEELCALWSDLPNQAITAGGSSLVDRLFNSYPFVQPGTELPSTEVFVHPALGGADAGEAADSVMLHRLLAGLRLDDEQLYLLITRLAAPLGLDLDSDDVDKHGFALSLENLSLLYRHARLAQALSLSISDLFRLIHLAAIPGGAVLNLDSLVALLAFQSWWLLSEHSLDDLELITGAAVHDRSRYPNAATLAAQLVDEVTAEQALSFSDAVFAFIPGISEALSRTIVEHNAAETPPLIAAAAGAFRLTAAFDPAQHPEIPAAVPADLALTSERAFAEIEPYHVLQVLPSRLSAKLQLSKEKTNALLALAGLDLRQPDQAQQFVAALQGGEIGPLTSLVERLIALSVLLRDEGFTVEAVTFAQTAADMFAIPTCHPGDAGFTCETAISIPAVQRVTAYREVLIAATEAQLEVATLNEVLATFQANADHTFAPAHYATLAALLNTEIGVVGQLLQQTLQDPYPLPPHALEAVHKLRRAGALTKRLQISGEVLRLIVSDDYAELGRAADALVGASRIGFDDEAAWAQALAQPLDTIRSGKRDALVDYLTHSVFPEFEDRNDLYYYYLIDVGLEGCARTSRVVAAISSAQLYVHRCRLNLEQNDQTSDLPDHVHVHVTPDLIPTDEWAWRKNYRVWEANRRVFLWPENYIEPGLRDDKSPLFEDFEAALLQQEINEQTVLDAYAVYARGFDEVAHLQVAGAYHEKLGATESPADILHLFGVTNADPPVYYYRRVENAQSGFAAGSDRGTVWRPWRQVNVQIPVRTVAPVVHRGRLYLFWIEIATRPVNQIIGGASVFAAYHHKMTLKFTTLRQDGAWDAPQRVSLFTSPYTADAANRVVGDGVVYDAVNGDQEAAFDPSGAKHQDAKEGYSLTGFQWDQVYPHDFGNSGLYVTGRNFRMRSPVDLYRLSILGQWGTPSAPIPENEHNAPVPSLLSATTTTDGNRVLFFNLDLDRWCFDNFAFASLLLEKERWDVASNLEHTATWDTLDSFRDLGTLYQPGTEVARLNVGVLQQGIRDELSVINGSESDVIVDSKGDLVLLSLSPEANVDTTYLLRRLGTTLSNRVGEILFSGGLDALLATTTQESLKEGGSPIAIIGHVDASRFNQNKLDFAGAMGVYFREIFFHAPFMIANHLNSQQQFEAAQRWYHYIFDPTATEVIAPDPDLSDEENERRQMDRNWRYLEFRNLGIPRLRDVLTDTSALAVYREDPFNPHAIARLRLSAYQKSVVMKYVDNLLDWGDQLFAQFTRESINEATLLYVLAADILGPRPAALGACVTDSSRETYEDIAPVLSETQEFLIELENLLLRPANGHASGLQPVLRYQYAADPTRLDNVIRTASRQAQPDADLTAAHPNGAGSPATSMSANGDGPRSGTEGFRGTDWRRTHIASWHGSGGTLRPTRDHWTSAAPVGNGSVARSLLQQTGLTFCIPFNDDLRGYWDRVEDRLFKIRNCLDIDGVQRQLALFAPAIDPRLLVRARAAGLSLDDVLAAIGGDLPPYRFAYLIERAKSFAATVQGYGSALLSALERRDLEQLNHLRLTQQANVLSLTTRMRTDEVKAAEEAVLALNRSIEAVTYRRDYFQDLISEGRNAYEIAEQVARTLGNVGHMTSATLSFVAATTYVAPQAGAPTAITYGGKQVGSSLKAWSDGSASAARFFEAGGAASGLQAGIQRRTQGWEHQAELAERELATLQRQLSIAEIRQAIAERALEIHETSIEQSDEMLSFYEERFSNLGLYDFLSTILQRVHRDAYNNAYAMARLAEQAFRFERGDDGAPALSGGYWESPRAGLLAGERLLNDLQNLERRFMETNYRSLEIDQPFSLAQVAPEALLQLRKTGRCTFSIGEVFFDLAYPGHYRRRMRSARLTIPCITGPYTNVSATLSLAGSRIRRTPSLETDDLSSVPPQRTVSIATSTAQNDGGVFELSFRDERYIPFEGAGAISDWSLELPASFRPFDYQTINDVIVHVSYEALYDGALRQAVEKLEDAAAGSIVRVLETTPLQRLFSLRQEFSGELHRLLHGPVGQEVRIELLAKHFPSFLRDRALIPTQAFIVLDLPKDQNAEGFVLAINGEELSGFQPEGERFGGLPRQAIPTPDAVLGAWPHVNTISVQSAGDLAPPAGDPSAVDGAKLTDVYLFIAYRLAPPTP